MQLDVDVSSLKALVLDIGGVLLSWAPGRSVKRMDEVWERRLDLEPGAMARRVWGTSLHGQATIGALRFEEYWPMVGAELGISDAELDELYQDYWDTAWFDPDVESALRALRPRLRLAALSNAWSNARHEVIQRYRLDTVLDTMVFSAEEGMAKPDPRIYHTVLDRLGIEPGEALFIDDVAANVAGAQRVGMHAGLSQSADELKALLDHINGQI